MFKQQVQRSLQHVQTTPSSTPSNIKEEQNMIKQTTTLVSFGMSLEPDCEDKLYQTLATTKYLITQIIHHKLHPKFLISNHTNEMKFGK